MTGTTGKPGSSTNGADAKPKWQPEIYTAEEALTSYLRTRESADWKPFSTGLETLDRAIGGGFCRGEYIVIGGRPGHGKTALVLHLLHGISKHQPTVFFSQEMSKLMLGKRMAHPIYGPIANFPKVDPGGDLPEAVLARHLDRRNCKIVGQVPSLGQLMQLMGEHVENDYGPKKPPRVVGVDYLQQIPAPGKTRYEQITNCSLAIRQATNHHKCATIVAAQLSREAARPGKDGTTIVREPAISDLKESGQIEQDADVILLVHRPNLNDRNKPEHEYVIQVAKNRNRPIVERHVMLAFDPWWQTFMTLDEWTYRNPVSDDARTAGR